MRQGFARLVCGIYCVLTAAYAFTSASAFTYQELIRPRMFGVGVFSQWHSVVFWPWLALMLVDLRASFRQRSSRRWAWGFAGVWTIVGIAITLHPLLPDLADNRFSLVVGAAALLPLVWAAVLDHATARDYLRRQPSSIAPSRRSALEGRWLTASLVAAALITIVYAVLTPMTMGSAFEPDLLTMGLVIGLAWTAVDQALIFCVGFLAIAMCARAVGNRPFVVQYATLAAALTVALASMVQRTVCDALGLEGAASAWVAISCAAAGVSTWGALRLRTCAARDALIESPVDVFFTPPPPGPGRRALSIEQSVPFAIIVLAAWGLGALSRTIDWDFLLLRSGVLLLWLAAVSRVLRVTPAVPLTNGWLALACSAPLAAHTAAVFVERHPQAVTSDPTFSIRRVLDRYTIYNPTFRLADGMLRPSLSSGPNATFMRFVRANTGLGADVAPPSLDFVRPLTAAAKPPHVFLFVVDSLRPDYLAPYNPDVAFTPHIARFASESLVFRNAFTRYGGTGLSLPAIWMGAVGVHKQYVRPFWPMNALEKLLTANQYRKVMSVDVIMEQLLRPVDPPLELDHGIRTMDYRLCRTLEELEAKMPISSIAAAPVFGYSLPQDLHVSNIMTASVPPGESYPGFHAPYAARVHAIDRCFGVFVDFLKRRGMYDNSIVVLTSDHGEMLGEEGRWGHAYYLFPQILQVPLLIHLPRGVEGGAALDPDAISFLTDITPTLYAALGYRPRVSNHLMGGPLIGPDRVDAGVRRRGDYVAAASYSAVYAVIRRNGRRIYIVDAIKGEEYAYERGDREAWRRTAVTLGLRTTGQRLIREHLDEIRRVYRMTGESESGALHMAEQ